MTRAIFAKLSKRKTKVTRCYSATVLNVAESVKVSISMIVVVNYQQTDKSLSVSVAEIKRQRSVG